MLLPIAANSAKRLGETGSITGRGLYPIQGKLHDPL